MPTLTPMKQHEIEVLVELIEELKGRLSSEQKRVHYHKKKANNLVEVVKIMKRKYQAYTVPAKKLEAEVKVLTESLEMQETLTGVTDDEIATKIDGKFTEDVRQCCFELLSMNVGVWNIRPVI